MSLRAEGLVKSYRGRRVVDRVDFEVHPGEVVGLLGPNGAGKSTSFGCVVGLVRPEAGEVWLGDEQITKLPLHQRARLGLGYLPQERSVFASLSVRQNLLAVLELRPDLDRSQRNERADALLEEFDLTALAASRGDQLSGGERRRTEIARCLAMEPRFVLFDEPFAGIDPLAVAELQQLILRLRSRDLGILMTDHNVRETLGICQRAYILVEGRVLVSGTATEIASNEIARTRYLGTSFQL